MLTQKRLKEVLDYNAETGEFTWKIRTAKRVQIGSVAGCVSGSTGYCYIRVDGELNAAHRLVFLYTEGSLPPEGVDHENGNRLDNRLENLRKASQETNSRNTAISSRNKSGFCGVSWHKQRDKWTARIKAQGKYLHLGLFDELSDAVKARVNAEIRYGYHTNHGRAA